MGQQMRQQINFMNKTFDIFGIPLGPPTLIFTVPVPASVLLIVNSPLKFSIIPSRIPVPLILTRLAGDTRTINGLPVRK